MEMTRIPRGPQPDRRMTDEEREEWRAYLRSVGITPATGTAPWPPRFPETIKPRFYRLRRWLIWPVRRLIRRHILR